MAEEVTFEGYLKQPECEIREGFLEEVMPKLSI